MDGDGSAFAESPISVRSKGKSISEDILLRVAAERPLFGALGSASTKE